MMSSSFVLCDVIDFPSVLNIAFGQRRKMLRQSLKDLFSRDGIEMTPSWLEKWGHHRPEELTPTQFLELTRDMYGSAGTLELGGGREEFILFYLGWRFDLI